MSFWLPSEPVVAAGSAAGGLGEAHAGHAGEQVKGGWHENDYCEIVREIAGDLVETVEKVNTERRARADWQIDEFTHPKSGKQSKTFRLNYRSMDRSLSNEEVNVLQEQVQTRVVKEMRIEMR
jgi:phenylalanyl-tRNA synthetase alpha chain